MAGRKRGSSRLRRSPRGTGGQAASRESAMAAKNDKKPAGEDSGGLFCTSGRPFPCPHARMGIPDERGRSPTTRRGLPGPSFGEPACAMRPPSALRTTGPAAAPGSLPGQPRTGHGRTGATGTSRYGPGSRTRAGSGTARFSRSRSSPRTAGACRSAEHSRGRPDAPNTGRCAGQPPCARSS